MPINAHPDYLAAEKEYHLAQTLEEKIEKLKKMISFSPSHKGAENLRAHLKRRYKKFLQQLEKSKKSGKSTQKGIKKQGMQAVIVGKTNTGKSTLLSALTKAYAKISANKFTTQKPIIGMIPYQDIQIQLVEIPAIESEFFDKGLIHTADTILLLITNLDQIKEFDNFLKKTPGKKIIVFNKFREIDQRKTEATLKSKKYNFVIINSLNREGFENLKKKIFESFNNIRIYTKEPGKPKSNKPLILKPNPTIKDVAEKILHGFSQKIKETKIWGPSSKFPGQKVGLKHILKDLDVVEFKTK